MTTVPQQPPLEPLSDLDPVFDLSETLEVSDDLRQMYEVLVARLRREAAAMPKMNTVQLLLIERIAYNYIVLRHKEVRNAADGGFAHATAQKEFNTFWLSMTTEFNKQLRAAPDGEFMEQFIARVKGCFNEALESVEDPELKKALRTRFADAAERAGL